MRLDETCNAKVISNPSEYRHPYNNLARVPVEECGRLFVIHQNIRQENI